MVKGEKNLISKIAPEAYRILQRSNLEGEISDILQSVAFDEKRFNRFFDNMFRLAERTEGGKVSRSRAVLIDIEANRVVSFLRIFDKHDSNRVQTRTIEIGHGGSKFKYLEYKEDAVSHQRKPRLITNERISSIPTDTGVRNFCQESFNVCIKLQNSPQL